MIPAQAVEAAAQAIYLTITGEPYVSAEDGGKERARELAIAALEAAAPHMLVPTAAEQAMDRILMTFAAVAAGQVPQDVAFTVIREISEHYTDRRTTP